MALKFFKGKEDCHVRAIRAVRARFVGPDYNEIDVEFLNEDKERLTIHLTPEQARALYEELGNAYQAINPPLNRSQHFSQWDGMS